MYKVSFRKVDIDGLPIVFRDAGVDVALASAKGGQVDRKALSLIEDALSAGKPVALACHAPGILTNVKAPNGAAIAEGRAVTGFPTPKKPP
jgi:putative intracellular protease/amidase